MRIEVKVQTDASRDKVQETVEGTYKVWTKESPVCGKANKRVSELIGAHFNVGPRSVILVRGRSSRNKIFDLKL